MTVNQISESQQRPQQMVNLNTLSNSSYSSPTVYLSRASLSFLRSTQPLRSKIPNSLGISPRIACNSNRLGSADFNPEPGRRSLPLCWTDMTTVSPRPRRAELLSRRAISSSWCMQWWVGLVQGWPQWVTIEPLSHLLSLSDTPRPMLNQGHSNHFVINE